MVKCKISNLIISTNQVNHRTSSIETDADAQKHCIHRPTGTLALFNCAAFLKKSPSGHGTTHSHQPWSNHYYKQKSKS
jgi:hypothetical protein